MKLTDLLKELGIEEGKVYTDKDRPPFKVVEGGPGSGPHGDGDDKEDNPFDREPSDDELKDIEKQFEGTVNEGVDFKVVINDKKGKLIQGGNFTLKSDANLYIKDMMKKHKLKREKGFWGNRKTGVEMSTNF